MSNASAKTEFNCDTIEVAKLRAQFLQEYNNKNYKKAVDILSPVVHNCKISPQEELWIENDLMLASVKLKDYWSACRIYDTDISTQMEINKVVTTEKFKKAYKNVSANCEGDYFGVMNKIAVPPKDAKAINACDDKEKEKIIALLKSSIENKDDVDTLLNDAAITIYKGDFSNRGRVDYAIVSEQGSGHFDTITFYHLEGNKLVNVDSDYTKFVEMQGEQGAMNVADPFAFVKNNKVYIRFMTFSKRDHFDYDPSGLSICTYLLQGNQLSLAGPNLAGTWPEYQLVQFDDCNKPK